MQWTDVVAPCANEICDKKVVKNGRMVKGLWVEDEENVCCCSSSCHKKHEEMIHKKYRDCGDISDS